MMSNAAMDSVWQSLRISGKEISLNKSNIGAAVLCKTIDFVTKLGLIDYSNHMYTVLCGKLEKLHDSIQCLHGINKGTFVTVSRALDVLGADNTQGYKYNKGN